MSSSIDKALLAMSIAEEEDIPFNLLDRSEFCSSQNNSISVIGRLLNPESQKMSSLILDMPRKWQKYDKVRGVALTKERFQFVFKHEHDLVEVLEKGVHSFNDWALAIERWVEKPPEDYLKYLLIWVRLYNVPVNYYTAASITALGNLVGQVVEVAFDPAKAQNQEYVRVKVRFNIANPLRRSKIVNLPNGEQTTVRYEYEIIHKRCFSCQCLTHDQSQCPLRQKSLKPQADLRKQNLLIEIEKRTLFLKISDPLFGVLKEDQVGINVATGRPRIAKEVLEGMRQYLISANGPERVIREERVKASLEDIANDPIAQKSMLSLEHLPIVTNEVDKGKGLVFEFEGKDMSRVVNRTSDQKEKLMASAFKDSSVCPIQYSSKYARSMDSPSESMEGSFRSLDSPTVYRANADVADYSGTTPKAIKQRRRPPKNMRSFKARDPMGLKKEVEFKKGVNKGLLSKRKAEAEGKYFSTYQNRKLLKVVPKEGLPKSL